jgi:hypothetical protein
MTTKFAPRGAKGSPSPGVRRVSSTLGQPQYTGAADKFADNSAFHVEGPAEQLVSRLLDIDPEVTRFVPQAFGVDLVAGTLLHTKAAVREAMALYEGEPGPCVYTVDYRLHFGDDGQSALEVAHEPYAPNAWSRKRIELARPILERHGVLRISAIADTRFALIADTVSR